MGEGRGSNYSPSYNYLCISFMFSCWAFTSSSCFSIFYILLRISLYYPTSRMPKVSLRCSVSCLSASRTSRFLQYSHLSLTLSPFMPMSSSAFSTSSSRISKFSLMSLHISSCLASLSVSKLFRYSLWRFLLNAFYHSTISFALATKREAKFCRKDSSVRSG